MSQRTTIAIDISKTVFALSFSTKPGRVDRRKRLNRKKLIELLSNTEPALILLEACGMSHFWARKAKSFGHEVRLLPPHSTRPYVLRDKTDATDADGLLEASRNEQILPVPVKNPDQQAIMGLHRIRERLKGDRTARFNLLRAVLREQGISIPVGAKHVLPRVLETLADAESAVPIMIRDELYALCEQVRMMESRIKCIDEQLKALGKQMPEVQLLLSIPGVGVITATAMVAFVGNVSRFKTSRQLASYFGLTPREHSTGLRRFLGSISKRGNVYLRSLLVNGARSALRVAGKHAEDDALRAWALRVKDRRGPNKAAVGLANKLARVIWAVWSRNEPYRNRPVLAA